MNFEKKMRIHMYVYGPINYKPRKYLLYAGLAWQYITWGPAQ